MRCWKILIPLVLICSAAAAMESRLPFSTVFRGQDQFNRLVAKAKSENWTAHVGLALRTNDGVLHFMHASSPGNSGRVIVDAQPSKYLYRYRTDSGILVARPLR